ncbi:hypothetical protein [Streptomyces sp. NPDC002851]
MGVKTYWPGWLIRLSRRTTAGRFEWAATLAAVIAGVMVSGVLGLLSNGLDEWCRFFGVIVGFFLLWFVAMGAPKAWAVGSYLIALCLLVGWSMLNAQDRALSERGEWTTATVASREDTPKNSYCTLRFKDGTETSGPIGGCRNAQVGDSIRVFYDPQHEMRPSNTAPNVPLWLGLSAGSTLIMAACTHTAAKRGRRRYAASVPPSGPGTGAPYGPPPPPPPPPGSYGTPPGPYGPPPGSGPGPR